MFRGTSKVSKILRAPAKELEWDSDQVIDAVVKVFTPQSLFWCISLSLLFKQVKQLSIILLRAKPFIATKNPLK